MLKQFNFLKVALLDRKIGAITRSSKYVINAVVRNFDGQILHRVVEYGPGDGVMTREILSRMPIDGQLIAVETNHRFFKALKKINDPRLRVIRGTAQEVSKELKRHNRMDVDLIVSSIPFSILKSDDRESIVSNTFNTLKSDGKFIIFHQYSPLMLGLLNKYFNTDAVNTQFELRNILPCFIMSAQKQPQIS